MSNMIRFFIAITCAFFVAALLDAGTVVPKGNESKGRYYFRQTCKDCHTKGAKGGEVTPLTKTQAQWRTYFTKGKHAGEPIGKVMGDAQLLDVQTYLVNHAA